MLTDADGNVRGAVLAEARLGKSEDGAVRPGITAGTEFEVACDTILVAIGQQWFVFWCLASVAYCCVSRRLQPQRGIHQAREAGRTPRHRGNSSVAKYFADHCVVRWLQMDDDASYFAHFLIAVLHPAFNE